MAYFRYVHSYDNVKRVEPVTVGGPCFESRFDFSSTRRIAGLGFLPLRLRARVMNKFMATLQKRDVLQDVAIWSRKQYRSRPRLCRSDGEIMAYRTYCAQFYPDQPISAAGAEMSLIGRQQRRASDGRP